MKKIVFVESYPHVLFGQQRTLLSLLDACPVAGIEPLVAATAEGHLVDEVRRRGIPVTILPYPELLSSYGGAIYRYRGWRYLRMLAQWARYLLSLRRALRRLDVAGVYCNDMRGLLTAGLAARSLGLPVLTWDKLDKPHGWLDWLQLPLVCRNLIISDAVLKKYPAWQKRLFRRRIHKVSEGADLKRFDQAVSIRHKLPGEADDVLLAIVGSITPRKGHDRIFSLWPDLIAACPNVRLLVIGKPSGSAEDVRFLDGLPNRTHPRIHFLGMRDDVPNLMRSTDALLVPSRQEGMGLVVVEAMAAGVPVIGANAGGIPEVVVDGETGLIVEGDDRAGWLAAIARLAGSPELRTRMGVAGRRRVECEFNRPVQMAKVLRHCLEMTDGH
ncbi:glycosyltransferase involved in cell wall biosynthesis [Sulfuritortus calidifontis]|uniref:Glycosyltransferase involved in cell wall biosynthesis n=1 Tax=Sulfuritortus calidifontis TaxID=1914471 RepID=A0A4R3JVH5_9PROT|nr:glycosyltransferase family 4 protein [Sulfuritortus calidifontis]TCS71933.1 glycosyltransferase involved in cell wall biosynthesis [Sulfuritortus calidifontis]